MTQSSEIQELLERKDFEPAECISRSIPECTRTAEEEDDGKGPVLIVSLMTFLNGAFPTHVGEDNDHKSSQLRRPRVGVDQDDVHHTNGAAAVFTVDEIYERVAKLATNWLSTVPHAHTIVIAGDKQPWIRKEKYFTQKKRDQRMELYPMSAKLSDDGITVDGITGGIQVQRLMATRALRPPLFELISDRFRQDKRLGDVRIVLDLTCSPPLVIHDGQTRSAHEWASEGVGEDDLLMAIWGCRFADHPIVFMSKDRDMTPILLLHQHKFRRPAYLQFGDGRVIHLQGMAAKLESHGWTMDAWATACIVSGSDFYNKSDTTYYINVSEIMASIFRLCAKAKRKPIVTEAEFSLWLRLIYSKAMHFDGVRTEAYLRRKGKVGHVTFPTKELQAAALQRLQFNFHYWKSLDFTLYKMNKPKDTTTTTTSAGAGSGSGGMSLV